MQSGYGVEGDDVKDIAAEELDLDGFFEDDIVPQSSRTFTEGPGAGEAIYDNSAGLDDSVSFGSRAYNTTSEEINGFDTASGAQWVYPSNLPTRSYQYNIVQKALFTNTLVTLPTGLGKTFIAAVVMYNFYRWYPSGKVIFLAPTKPLVAQQVKACYNIMGIPKAHTTEMTGSLAPEKRVEEWKRKRVFFLTPQVMQNDLTRCSCPADQVVCIVFDEAHKALGNHAYCQVIKGLVAISNQFRVLALTATPGDDLKAIQQVLTNLMISHIELRSEESIDVRTYVHQRKVDKVVVSLDGEIKEIRNAFLKILSRIVNRLVGHRVLYAIDPEKLSRYQLLQARDKFRSNPDLQGRVPVGSIEGDFAVCISLYHAFELLQVHGMRSFYQTLSQFLEGPPSRGRSEVTNDTQFASLLRRLRGNLEEVDSLDGNSTIDSRVPLSQMYTHNVGHSFFYSHPKLRRLEEIVLNHFKSDQSSSSTVQTTFSPSGSLQKGGSVHQEATRVMIFSQYRDSVKEIATMLSRHSPLVRVMSFVGQASSGKSTKGLTQKEQLQVVAKFRDGGYNTLVATCVGEEGLDIGDVDLIICFDAHNSPVRLIQRMGRTGRKRSGRIVVLMTEGKEERVYQQSQSNKKSIYKIIKAGCKSLQFYGNSFRMVPKDIHPQVCHLHMHIAEEVTPKKGTKSKTGHTKGKQQNRLSFGIYQSHIPGTLTDNELLTWKERYALTDRKARDLHRAVSACVNPQKLLCLQKHDAVMHDDVIHDDITSDTSECSSTTGRLQLSLDRWMEWQRAPVPTGYIGHSSATKQLVKLLQFTENAVVSSDFISGYDMEMQMFLNNVDIVPFSSNQRNEEPTISSSIATAAESRPSEMRGKRRLCFDSEDDDFVISSSSKKQAVVGSSDNKNGGSHSVNILPANNMVDSTSPSVGDEPAVSDNVSLVPPPPNINSLSWMDHLPSSQSPNKTFTSTPLPLNYSTPVKTPSKTMPKLVSPNSKKSFSPKYPFLSAPVGTSSKFVTDSRTSSPKQHKPAPPKAKKVTTPKLVATLEASSQTLSPKNNKVVTPKQSIPASPKRVSLVGTPYSVTQSDGNQGTKSGQSPAKVKQNTLEFAKVWSPNKPSPLLLKKKPTATNNPTISLVAKANLKTPTKVSAVKPITPIRQHAFALRSPVVRSPTCAPITDGKLDDAIDTIPESDMECEETPIACTSHSKNNELEEDSFAVLHNKKKSNKEPSFLCTQLPPAALPHRTKRKVIDSSTDDDFTPVKKKCRFAKEPSISTTQEEDYLDLEAEESSNDVTLTEDNVDEQEVDMYDVDDSFINDATQLTQLPSRSPVNMDAIYKQSLISPNNAMFAGKPMGQGAKYRMRISRNHKLLNHFIGRAGIEVMASDQSQYVTANNSFTGSEAEEEYLPLSQEDSDTCDKVTDVTPQKPSNRRAVIMTPASVTESPRIPRHQTASDVPPKKALFSSQANPPVASIAPMAAMGQASSSCSKEVIVSPSLILTPPPGTDFASPRLACFSLGMDEWMFSESSVDRLDQQIGSSHLVADSLNLQKHLQVLTVLVNSKEISNPQIVSLLRQKHHVKVTICQLGYVNYMLSNRTAMQRLMQSDLCTAAGVRKAALELGKVKEMYDRVYVLVEKDHKKSGPSHAKMGYYYHAIVQLGQAGVSLLFSQSPEETAVLISKVAASECSSGFGIDVPVEMDSMKQNVHDVLFSQPHMSYTIALSLCHHYDTLHDIINCSPEDMQAKIPFINATRAKEICNFFKRKFNKDLT